MVKVGFICEGATERIILSSAGFERFLSSLGIELVDEIIDAEGCGNLLPHNIGAYILRLENKGATKIFLLRDLDDYPCFTSIKGHLEARKQDVVIIAVKAIEAWFLSNTAIMRLLLDKSDFFFDYPENELEPFETINQLLSNYKGRGIGKKKAGKQKLANKIISLGFSIQDSASHPNCGSAKYFIDKLTQLTAN
jgi:hypothetical protein